MTRLELLTSLAKSSPRFNLTPVDIFILAKACQARKEAKHVTSAQIVHEVNIEHRTSERRLQILCSRQLLIRQDTRPFRYVIAEDGAAIVRSIFQDPT